MNFLKDNDDTFCKPANYYKMAEKK